MHYVRLDARSASQACGLDCLAAIFPALSFLGVIASICPPILAFSGGNRYCAPSGTHHMALALTGSTTDRLTTALPRGAPACTPLLARWNILTGRSTDEINQPSMPGRQQRSQQVLA